VVPVVRVGPGVVVPVVYPWAFFGRGRNRRSTRRRLGRSRLPRKAGRRARAAMRV